MAVRNLGLFFPLRDPQHAEVRAEQITEVADALFKAHKKRWPRTDTDDTSED